jgi:hypothetical protein
MVQSGNFKGKVTNLTFFKKSDNKKIALSNIEKTSEFRDSNVKEAGAGVATTDVAESASAIIASYYIKKGFSSRTDCFNHLTELSTEEIIREFSSISNTFDVTSSIEGVSNFIKKDKD